MGSLLSRVARQVARAPQRRGVAGPATLIKVTPGTHTPGSISGGSNPTETPHTARGWIDDFDLKDIDGTIVVAGDRLVNLLGATIQGGVSPAPSDKVTIGGATYLIKRTKSDPANALYVCQTHGPGTTA